MEIDSGDNEHLPLHRHRPFHPSPQSSHSASRLNRDDACPSLLEVSDGGRTIKYVGRGRDDAEAAAVRSDRPLLPLHGGPPIGYFEVTVVDQGRDGYLSVGVMARRCGLDKLVGWGEGAVGYHGDDGNIFKGSGAGRPFGPLWTKGDVVGCLIDGVKGRMAFTKNGLIVGSSVKIDIESSEDEYYAAVGLRTPNETVRANFGQDPFVFDTDRYLNALRYSLMNEQKQKSASLTNQTEVVEIVAEYLLFHGYSESLLALKAVIPESEWENDLSDRIEQRKLQLQILGQVSEGGQLSTFVIQTAFPTATSSPVASLLLSIREFVEGAFREPGNLAELLERARTVNEHWETMKNDDGVPPEWDLPGEVFSLLAYRDPVQSEEAREIRKVWQRRVERWLDADAAANDTLLELIRGIQTDINDVSRICPRKRRIWSVLDDTELWIGTVLD